MQKLWWDSCQAEIGVKWQFWDVLELQSFGRFRTGRNLDLWNSVWVVFCQLSRVLHEFSFLLHDMSMGFMRRNHCDLFCSFVKGCACIGSWMWVLHVCVGLYYFLFCLRHWSLVDHILPVKMCGTHLGVVLSVIFVGSVIHLLRCESRTLGWTRESLCLAWHEMAEL